MELKEGYKMTEVGIIPTQWEIKTYGEIFTFLNTATYSRADLSENGDVSYVHYGDIHTKFHFILDFNTETLPTIHQDQLRQYDQIKDGDIIMADASEDYSGVGKSIEVRNVGDQRAISGLHTFLLRDKHKALVDGFRAYLHVNQIIKQQFDRLATGMKVYGVSRTNLKTVFIPIPTKPEQTAISTALNDADALINGLGKLIAKKRLIKQGAMQELLRPKKGWAVKRLGELGKTYGGLSGKSKVDFKNGIYPFIPFMNIMSNPIIDIDNFDFVNIKSGENQNKALKGDLFFNGSSETPEEVGMCSVLNHEIPNLYLNSFCFGFRLFPELGTNGLFLSYLFRSPYGRKLFYSSAQGATRYNLSKSNFLKLEVDVPPPSQQEEIANILYDIDIEIDALVDKLGKWVTMKQGMMQTLLTGKIRLQP